jgi:hypothetical protein
LTVAIFEADVFDAAFASLVTENAEGVLLTGKGKRGLQFTEANIRRYVTDTEVSATGAACLNLTWRHRVSLGLSSA